MVKRSTTDFDAIVIGAGHNGLVTAAYLAKSGLSTLLIEARSDVGGTAASDSFAGASVNICNCDHLTFRTTPVAEELNLASHGLEYINVEPPQINGDWTSEKMWPLWHDVEQTIESLASVHPDAIDGYRCRCQPSDPRVPSRKCCPSWRPWSRHHVAHESHVCSRCHATVF